MQGLRCYDICHLGAKNPQLWSKLEQAPISLISRNVKREIDKFQAEANIDEYIGALIDAIRSGDFCHLLYYPHCEQHSTLDHRKSLLTHCFKFPL